MATKDTTSRPACPSCAGPGTRWGKDRNGHQRFRCAPCGKSFAFRPARPLGAMRIPLDRALLCLNLLVEGNSIRSTERVTGTHRDTILRLLVLVGGRCAETLERLVRGVEVTDVQADEVWCYVGMKERVRVKQGVTDPKVGDAYTFTAVDRDSKLLLAWHLGRRTHQHTDAFVEKLSAATAGHFQLTTDGFSSYVESVGYHLGSRTDFAQLIKHYAADAQEERRYSPPQVIGTEKIVVHGNPEEDRICTSHVERQNLTIRMSMRRFTRLTNAYSKKWENLWAALALHFAYYNFCRMHSSIRMTPGMKAGVTRAPWTLAQLVAAVAQ